MKIRVIARFPLLADAVKDQLQAAGYKDVEALCDATLCRYQLHHPESLSAPALAPVMEAIAPFNPPIQPDQARDTITVELGDVYNLDHWNLKVFSDTDQHISRLEEALVKSGFAIEATAKAFYECNLMLCEKAPLMVQHYIQWILNTQQLVEVESGIFHKQDISDTHNSICVYIAPPYRDKHDIKEHVNITIVTDDPYHHELSAVDRRETISDFASRCAGIPFLYSPFH